MRRASAEHGSALARALRSRRHEIEEATLLRVHAVSALPRGGDPEYAVGLRAAISAGVDYGLEGVERGAEALLPVPEALLAQARLAARSGVSLDTVLRRYLAGHTLLEDFLISEAERARSLGTPVLGRLLRSQAQIVDRLLATVSTAYTEEASRRQQSAERRKAEKIERLLAGEPIETAELHYPFEAHHLAFVAFGPRAQAALEFLAKALDVVTLSAAGREQTLWVWLGSKSPLDPGRVLALGHRIPPGLTLALGEPGEGLAGWRRSHRQARAALSVALRGEQPAVRYADVALLASALQDDLLARSLRHIYLEPLEAERDGGAALRETLRAYFAAQHNVSSAAAALGVTRQTVASRLRTVEEQLERPLSECAPELALALRLHAMGAS